MMRAAQPSTVGCARRRAAPTAAPRRASLAAHAALLHRQPTAVPRDLGARRSNNNIPLALRPAAAATATATATTSSAAELAEDLAYDAPAPNPRPPRGTSAAYAALAAAHLAAAAALAALSLTLLPGIPPLTSLLALGPASSVLAPALGACLAAASVRAAGLCWFVRSAALAAEAGDAGQGQQRQRQQQKKQAAGAAATATASAAAATITTTPAQIGGTSTTQDAESAAAVAAAAAAAAAEDDADDDAAVFASAPLPTELRTWRYQRPNAALLAFGCCSAAAHVFGLVAAGMALASSPASSSASAAAPFVLPLAGTALSAATAAVSARALRWASADAPREAGRQASGALAGIAFACEPLAEAFGGSEDAIVDRTLATLAAQRIEMGRDAEGDESDDAADVAAWRRWRRGADGGGGNGGNSGGGNGDGKSGGGLPLDVTQPDLREAANACLAHLARDVTTLQGLALTATWVSSLGAFFAAALVTLLPWPRALPAVAAAAGVLSGGAGGAVSLLAAVASDPALAYLLAAAGVAALPATAGHAHALCEHAAYTRRLDVPGTLRASLLARLTRVARRRRLARGRAALRAAAGASGAAAGGGGAAVPASEVVLDVRLDADDAGADAALGEASAADSAAAAAAADPAASAASTPPAPSEVPAALFPPPPHNAPTGRFRALRASYALAAALQFAALVVVGAPAPDPSSSLSAAGLLASPRLIAAPAAARAALAAPDPALAALHWVALLAAAWLAGQLTGLDFRRVRAAVVEGVDLASRVVAAVVRGLFWDAFWVMQNRVRH